jgi:DNA polymerase-3 subunit gamma/tau
MITEADRMAERSLSFEMALQELGTLLHRFALVQIVPQVAAEDPDAATLRELAGLFSAEELQLYYQIAAQARSEIGLAPDEYAGFTMALLRMLAFAPSAEAPPARAARAAPAAEPQSQGAASADLAANEERLSPPALASADGATWAVTVEKLGLSGMARLLAQHCELVRLDNERIELRLPKAHERLLEKTYEERLKAALQKHFRANLRLSIVVGEDNGSSPVAIAGRERDRQQAKAIAEIEQDPFVRDLVENFDARVNESSIKPLQ